MFFEVAGNHIDSDTEPERTMALFAKKEVCYNQKPPFTGTHIKTKKGKLLKK
jgi:hypothetical protein